MQPFVFLELELYAHTTFKTDNKSFPRVILLGDDFRKIGDTVITLDHRHPDIFQRSLPTRLRLNDRQQHQVFCLAIINHNPIFRIDDFEQVSQVGIQLNVTVLGMQNSRTAPGLLAGKTAPAGNLRLAMPILLENPQ